MRLEMTPDLIQKNALNTVRVTEEGDWTSRYASESPWTVELAYTSSSIELRRLVDRHPDFIESYLEYARTSGFEAADKIDLEWSDDIVRAPNFTDTDTVITLALISSNAYARHRCQRSYLYLT
jgi:lipase ATG15